MAMDSPDIVEQMYLKVLRKSAYNPKDIAEPRRYILPLSESSNVSFSSVKYIENFIQLASMRINSKLRMLNKLLLRLICLNFLVSRNCTSGLIVLWFKLIWLPEAVSYDLTSYLLIPPHNHICDIDVIYNIYLFQYFYVDCIAWNHIRIKYIF